MSYTEEDARFDDAFGDAEREYHEALERVAASANERELKENLKLLEEAIAGHPYAEQLAHPTDLTGRLQELESIKLILTKLDKAERSERLHRRINYALGFVSLALAALAFF